MSNLRLPYEGGIQQYRGLGVVKYCLICQTHRPTLGGRMKRICGGSHWVCNKHEKKEPVCPPQN